MSFQQMLVWTAMVWEEEVAAHSLWKQSYASYSQNDFSLSVGT